MRNALDEFTLVLNDELLPQLESERTAAKNQLDSMLASLVQLNQQNTVRLTDLQAQQSQVEAKHTTMHNACNQQDGYGGYIAWGGPACAEYAALQASLRNNPAPPTTDDDAAWQSYVEAISTSCIHHPTQELINKRHACEAERTARGNACHTATSDFELHFCLWRNQFILDCTTHAQEFQTARQLYLTRQSAVMLEIPDWRHELIAIRKIQCYLNVWLTEEDTSTTMATCVNLETNTDQMDIPEHSNAAGNTHVPAAGTCDTSPVNNYGTEIITFCEGTAAPGPAPAPVGPAPAPQPAAGTAAGTR
eukprot:gnl/TRDRNA2_/TRDRNA2_143595_c2_seq1.p1 gnl/TRDRNA2_/TRDRNA2_143595_c2~~gnl/TRDRNA2_/TRDRNA2_143595_c2_seq1.p1  ORF type:complete len:328 (+),score=47.22 gnl/TRDRNA2_/TRDRNA2_143595_c2_seq1:67-984(+)